MPVFEVRKYTYLKTALICTEALPRVVVEIQHTSTVLYY